MIEIQRLPESDERLDGIKDNMHLSRLNLRLDNVQFLIFFFFFFF